MAQGGAAPAPRGWIVQGPQNTPPPQYAPPAPDHRSRATPYIIATYVTLGVGAVIAFGIIPEMDQIEALVYAIPFLIAAGVLGIVGAVAASRERDRSSETAAATAGAVFGAAGAVFAAVTAIILVLLAIMAAFMWMMMCLMTFGMGC